MRDIKVHRLAGSAKPLARRTLPRMYLRLKKKSVPIFNEDEPADLELAISAHRRGRSVVDVEEKNKEGRYVGLDFYDRLSRAARF